MTPSPWNSFGGSDGWLNLVHVFGGIEIAQTYSAFFWLDRCFIEHPQLECAMELGTLYGALSSYLGLCFPGRVVTCDNQDHRKPHARALHKRLGVHFKLANVLRESAPKDLLSLCRAKIGYSKKSSLFLFCDNGGK